MIEPRGMPERRGEERACFPDDSQYIERLRERDDIFHIEKQRILRKIGLFSAAASVAVGSWLSTLESARNLPAAEEENRATLRMAGIAQETPIAKKEFGISRGWEEPVGRPQKATPPQETPSQETSLPAVGTAKPAMVSAEYEREGVADNEPPEVLVQESVGKAGELEAFLREIEKNPRDTDALAGAGDFFLRKGHLDSAAHFYMTAIAVNPRLAPVRNNLGTVRYYYSKFAANPRYAARKKITDPEQYSKAQYDSAIAEYTSAIAIDSSYVDALTNRAVIRELGGDRKSAIEDYSLAIKINPSWADAYRKRAATYKAMGKFSKAIADYTAAINLDSSTYKHDPTLRFANAYFGRGTVYYKSGNLDKAIADFDATLALRPGHTLAMINKGVALIDKKRYEDAISILSRAIERLSPLEYDNARKYAYLHRANAFRALRMYERAIADYENTLELPAVAARACWRIAKCHALMNDRESALNWLRRSVYKGFTDFNAWKRDPDLASLRNDREFRDLISGK